MKPLLTFVCAVLALATGCVHTADKNSGTTASSALPSGADEQIFRGDTLEQHYDPHVILKRAEAFFEKEMYADAIAEYMHFLDLHRAHVLVPYANVKLAESYLKQTPFVDRDMSGIVKAREILERFLNQWPGNQYEGDVRTRLKECRERLAENSFFIGMFYYRRESYFAALHRFEELAEKYPEAAVVSQALFYAARSYEHLGANDRAEETLALLKEKYPESEFR